jgi:hypothetical protein
LFAGAVLDYIAKNHIKNVIMAATWNSYVESDSTEAQILKTFQAVLSAGARVYFLKGVPLQAGDIRQLTAAAIWKNDGLEATGITRGQLAAQYQGWDDTLARLKKTGATVLDPDGFFLSDKGLYGFVKNDQVLYFDSQHLTVEGALLLAPLFEPIFHTN